MSRSARALPSLRPMPGIRRHPGLLPALFALLALCLTQSACITRTVRETVFDSSGTEVKLRAQKRGGKLIDRGFDHPIAIAPVRLAHILSRIDIRREDGKDAKRVPAIPLETLYTIADGISQALEKADSSQEVVVQSVRRHKHWGVFDRHYLTSLLCYVQDDLLYIHISRSEWEIPHNREDRLPETHVGEHPLGFRLVVEKGMSLADEQSVAVSWRDDIFRKPTRTRVTPGGKVVRRTILMETVEDETDYGPPTPQVSDQLSPAQLRDLADLEEERQNGGVTESEYNARRNRILRGDDTTP